MNVDHYFLDWAITRVDGAGRRDVFHVRVWPPQYSETPFPAWRCAFTVEGHFERKTPVVGATAVQALCLAMKVVREILRGIAKEATLTEVESGQPLNEETLTDAIN